MLAHEDEASGRADESPQQSELQLCVRSGAGGRDERCASREVDAGAELPLRLRSVVPVDLTLTPRIKRLERVGL